MREVEGKNLFCEFQSNNVLRILSLYQPTTKTTKNENDNFNEMNSFIWVSSKNMMLYVCLLITLTRSPKAELRRAQLNRIGRMHMKGASGCRQTVMNDPGAQKPSQMFSDLGKGQTTTPGTPCPTRCE